jgi:hypothetical protein
MECKDIQLSMGKKKLYGADSCDYSNHSLIDGLTYLPLYAILRFDLGLGSLLYCHQVLWLLSKPFCFKHAGELCIIIILRRRV